MEVSNGLMAVQIQQKKHNERTRREERNMDKAKLGEILMMFVQTICLLRILKKLEKR